MPWPNPDARFGRRVSANFSDTQARAILTRHERDVWDLGRIVSLAQLRCEHRDCGIEGPNPDARFGKWVSTNFGDTQTQRLYEARRLWEVFGERREEMAFVPLSGLYALAEPKCDLDGGCQTICLKPAR